jgi:proline dehydrogenase
MYKFIPFYNRFIGGPHIKGLQHKINTLAKFKYKFIIDYAVEYDKDINKSKHMIMKCMSTVPNSMYAIKLTSLDIEKSTDSAYYNMQELCNHAVTTNNKIIIDAENVKVQEGIDKVSYQLLQEYNLVTPLVYQTYQMYRIDSYSKLQNDIENIPILGIKMCRGAYHNEDKHTGKLFLNIEDTHKSFNEGIKLVSKNIHPNMNVIVGTHNEDSISLSRKLNPVDSNMSYAQLLGMSDKLSVDLINKGETVYKYVPFGPFMSTVPYLGRRLFENYKLIKYILK